MKAGAALFGVALLLAACGAGPRRWEEAMDLAYPPYKAREFPKALAFCKQAFDFAQAAKSGSKALGAMECIAEAADLAGRGAEALPYYAALLRDHEETLRNEPTALRLRYNYGIALLEAGQREAGLAMLDDSLEAYAGFAAHSSSQPRLRMLLAAALAKAVRDDPDSPRGVRISSVMLEEILRTLEAAKVQNTASFTLGAADALDAIADLVGLRGDPSSATELRAQAKEQRAIEAEILAAEPSAGSRCQIVVARNLTILACLHLRS